MLLEIAAAVLVLTLAGLYWWRRRQAVIATDELARKPVAPPSPYAPSRGFKILADDEAPAPEEAPPVPKIETDGELIFGDGLHLYETPAMPKLRHDEQWAIDRSMRRVPPLRSLKRRRQRLAMAGVVLLAAVVVLFETGLL